MTKAPKQIKVAGKIYDRVPNQIKVAGKIYTRIEAAEAPPAAPVSKKYYVSLPGGVQVIVESKSSGQALMQLRKLIKSTPDLKGLKPVLLVPSYVKRIQKLLDMTQRIDEQADKA
jgi:hypothetical protein